MPNKTIQTRAFALKQRGKAADLNVVEIAEMGGIAPSTIYRWRKGDYGHFNTGGLERCEEAMDALEQEALKAQVGKKKRA